MPWDDFASAQLSFPYLMGLAARYRGIKFEHFDEKTRKDPAFAEFAGKLTVTAPAEIDQLYPRLRPARVTVTTAEGTFTRQADEALGLAHRPLDDEGLKAKFLRSGEPVFGAARAKDLSRAAVDDRRARRRRAAGRDAGEIAASRPSFPDAAKRRSRIHNPLCS